MNDFIHTGVPLLHLDVCKQSMYIHQAKIIKVDATILGRKPISSLITIEITVKNKGANRSVISLYVDTATY